MDRIEATSELMHDIWSRWWLYVMAKAKINKKGELVIPQTYTERWNRQLQTPYMQLSEAEKESDRKLAYEILSLVDKAN